jgi:hypothetical protein
MRSGLRSHGAAAEPDPLVANLGDTAIEAPAAQLERLQPPREAERPSEV